MYFHTHMHSYSFNKHIRLLHLYSAYRLLIILRQNLVAVMSLLSKMLIFLGMRLALLLTQYVELCSIVMVLLFFHPEYLWSSTIHQPSFPSVLEKPSNQLALWVSQLSIVIQQIFLYSCMKHCVHNFLKFQEVTI